MTTPLRELCSLNGISITATTRLADAAVLMQSNKKGAIVVVDGDAIAGIISERDFVKLLLRGTDLNEPAFKYATKNVVSVRFDRPISHALTVMTENEIRRLVVTNMSNKLAGLVTQQDIFAHIEDDSYRSNLRVSDILIAEHKLRKIALDASVEEALRIMSEQNISALPVFDGDRAVGLVSERTMLSLAVQGKPLDAQVKNFMRSPIDTIPESAFLIDASHKMETLGVHRLLATDKDGVPIGMITQRDILRNFDNNHQLLIIRKLRYAKDMFNLLPELALEIADNEGEQLIVWANKKAIEVLGKDAVDSPITKVIRKKEWRPIYSLLARSGRAEKIRITAAQNVFELSGVFTRGESGGENGRIKLIMRDVTLEAQKYKNIVSELTEYEKVINSAPDIMLLFYAKNGAIKIANEAAIHQLEMRRAGILKRTIFEIAKNYRGDLEKMFDEIVKHDRIVKEIFYFERSDGSLFPTEVSASKVVLDRESYILAIARNIGEKLALEEEIRRTNRQLKLFHSFNNDIIRATSLDEAFNILSFYLKNEGINSVHIYYLDAQSHIKSSSLSQAESLWTQDCLIDKASGCKAMIGGMRVVKNTGLNFGCPICKLNTEAKNYACISLYDSGNIMAIVTIATKNENFLDAEKQQFLDGLFNSYGLAIANMRLIEVNKELSIRDPLTGLFNRRFFSEFLSKQIENCRRGEKALSLIMIDLDDFKRINDMFGHDIGDRALVLFSRVIEENLRKGDMAARYGGEEFVLVLPNAKKSDAAQIAVRIKNTLTSTPIISRDENRLFITASFGVAMMDESDRAVSGEDMVRIADMRLYAAKSEGKNKVVQD